MNCFVSVEVANNFIVILVSNVVCYDTVSLCEDLDLPLVSGEGSLSDSTFNDVTVVFTSECCIVFDNLTCDTDVECTFITSTEVACCINIVCTIDNNICLFVGCVNFINCACYSSVGKLNDFDISCSILALRAEGTVCIVCNNIIFSEVCKCKSVAVFVSENICYIAIFSSVEIKLDCTVNESKLVVVSICIFYSAACVFYSYNLIVYTVSSVFYECENYIFFTFEVSEFHVCSALVVFNRNISYYFDLLCLVAVSSIDVVFNLLTVDIFDIIGENCECFAYCGRNNSYYFVVSVCLLNVSVYLLICVTSNVGSTDFEFIVLLLGNLEFAVVGIFTKCEFDLVSILLAYNTCSDVDVHVCKKSSVFFVVLTVEYFILSVSTVCGLIHHRCAHSVC